MARLTVRQQTKLLNALPAHRKMAVKRACIGCQQSGGGIKSAMSKARRALGPIAAEIGPIAFKKFILPMMLKKAGLSGTGKKRRSVVRRGGRPARAR